MYAWAGLCSPGANDFPSISPSRPFVSSSVCPSVRPKKFAACLFALQLPVAAPPARRRLHPSWVSESVGGLIEGAYHARAQLTLPRRRYAMQASTGLGDLGDALPCILVKRQVHATPHGKGRARDSSQPGASTFPNRLFRRRVISCCLLNVLSAVNVAYDL